MQGSPLNNPYSNNSMADLPQLNISCVQLKPITVIRKPRKLISRNQSQIVMAKTEPSVDIPYLTPIKQPELTPIKH